MDDISKLFDLLLQLMPGFLAAWVLYGFTSFVKPSQFERVVQALIFSFLIMTVLPIEKFLLLKFGEVIQLGVWSTDSELFATAITAIVFGLICSFFANNDKLYKLARHLKLTRRTAYPSEWFGAFSENITFTVLHLTGSRRIYGWPIQWPSDPNEGHFVLVSASWLDDEEEISLNASESIMIAAKDVEMVEFVKSTQEIDNGSKISEPASA